MHPIAIVERPPSQAAVGVRRRPQASSGPVFGSRGRAIRRACIAGVFGFERAVTVCARSGSSFERGRSRFGQMKCEARVHAVGVRKPSRRGLQKSERSWVRPRVGSVIAEILGAAIWFREPHDFLFVLRARRARPREDGSLVRRNLGGLESAR